MHAAFEVRMCDQSFASAQLSVARAMEALPQLMPRADKKRLSTRPSYGMLDKADRQGRFTTALPCEAAQRVDVDQAGRLETSRAVRCTCTFGCQVSSSQVSGLALRSGEYSTSKLWNSRGAHALCR